MLDFNLEYYRAFYYVARLKSITKAANALFLSQPAVTHSIKKLEEHFKCHLFKRLAHGVKLTSEGELLYARVSNAFDELMAGEKELSQFTDYVGGRLSIGTTETPLHYFLLPKIERFLDKYPKVYIQLSGSSTPETLISLREGTTDLAVVVSPVSDTDGLDVVEILSFRDVFVAGPKFSALKGRTITAHEICEYPIVTVEMGTSARKHIDHWFDRHGVLFNPEYVVRTSTAVLPFVERNLAIGIIPLMFAQELADKRELFIIDMDDPVPPRYILLIFRSDSHMTTLCRDFICSLSE